MLTVFLIFDMDGQCRASINHPIRQLVLAREGFSSAAFGRSSIPALSGPLGQLPRGEAYPIRMACCRGTLEV
ncbi:hypothetical protein [uncultured Dialister sp.]|uniref:hypothetical protein n=1 Tax=uncultured Dialister sp. TaxID=278064 RepID=UPI0025DB97E9|nr:hypothetical protein [uncultured Dialister sp.]